MIPAGSIFYREDVERIVAQERDAREDKLRFALIYLMKAGFNSRSLSGSGDCGDHCSNSCPWCEARAALAETGDKP
jgi:hypothetical protein